MSDYNEELSELHQRVVQDELGVPATIDDIGWVEFKDSDLGEMTITLREYNPEFMRLHAVVFADTKDTRSRDRLLRACNSANSELDSSQVLARLTVSEKYSIVRASVTLALAAPNQIPDEAFLRTVIVRAVSDIKAAANEFAAELQKIE